MANELKVNINTVYSKNGIVEQRTMNKSVKVAGDAIASGVQSIGTSHEVVAVADVATNGWARFLNIDSTNYVELGVVVGGTFYPLPKLMPGEPAVFRLSPGATLYARANTASVKMEYAIYES